MCKTRSKESFANEGNHKWIGRGNFKSFFPNQLDKYIDSNNTKAFKQQPNQRYTLTETRYINHVSLATVVSMLLVHNILLLYFIFWGPFFNSTQKNVFNYTFSMSQNMSWLFHVFYYRYRRGLKTRRCEFKSHSKQHIQNFKCFLY